MIYATLHEVRSYLRMTEYENGDDVLITHLLRMSSVWIDRYCQRRFDLYVEERVFDVPNDDALKFDTDLMQVISLVNGDGSGITPNYYRLNPANTFPKNRISLKKGKVWLQDEDGYLEQAIKLTALWGFHTSLTDAWEISGDLVQSGGINSAAATISVADSDGFTSYLLSPRFQVGHNIRIDDEQIFVAAVNNTTNTLTVIRGYNGTTPAAHSAGRIIYIFRPLANIVLATIRLTAWRYKQKDVDAYDSKTILASGAQIIPSSIPYDILKLLPVPRITL